MSAVAATRMDIAMDDASRVRELEYELTNLRNAFEEYISSSRELEDGLDKELAGMHHKLADSTAANDGLAAKLQTIEPLVRNLEASLEVTKRKLKDEAKLRRQAEVAQMDMENRYKDIEAQMIDLRGENDSLKAECYALHEELAFKCRELEDSKKSNGSSRGVSDGDVDTTSKSGKRQESANSVAYSSSGQTESGVDSATTSSQKRDAAATIDDSYVEVLDELETVTEQLIATQQKLWKTEDQLRESEARILELGNGKKKSQPGQNENKTKAELEEELAVAQEQLTLAKEQGQIYQSRLTALETSRILRSDRGDGRPPSSRFLNAQVEGLDDALKITRSELSKTKQLLSESSEENAVLVEEIACLRETLHDGNKIDLNDVRQHSLIKQGSSNDDLRDLVDELEQSYSRAQQEIARKDTLLKQNHERHVQLSRAVDTLKRRMDPQSLRDVEVYLARHPATIDSSEEEMRAVILKETREEREREFNVLREKFKVIVKENAELQRTVDKLETGNPQFADRRKEISKLKDEIQSLKDALKALSNSDQRELDASTRAEEQLQEIESIRLQMEVLRQENVHIETAMQNKERELEKTQYERIRELNRSKLTEASLIASREEILKLKKKSGRLVTELDHASKSIANLESSEETLRHQLSACKAELEVAKELLTQAGQKENIVEQKEGEVRVKKKVNSLSLALEKARKDYAALMAEFDAARQTFSDMQEETVRKSEDEIDFLLKELEDMKDDLEMVQKLNVAAVEEIEAMKEKHEEDIKAAELRGKEFAEAELKVHQTQERKLVMNRFDDLSDEKSQLQKELDDYSTTIAEYESKLADTRTVVEPLQRELEECQEALASSRAQVLQLERQLGLVSSKSEDSSSSYAGRNILNTLFGDPQRTREARDPEPIRGGEGNPGESKNNPAGTNQTLVPAKDPPTSRGLILSSEDVKTQDPADAETIDEVRSRLHDVEIENRVLKRRVLEFSAGNATNSRQNASEVDMSAKEEIMALKEQVDALQMVLENSEGTSAQVQKLEHKLGGLEVNLQLKDDQLALSKKSLAEAKDHNKALMEEISSLNSTLKEVRSKLYTAQGELESLKVKNSNELRKVARSTGAEAVAKENKAKEEEDLKEVRSQLKQLAEEKASLQHQVDDTKIALSVAQYAQERNKEDLRSCEAKLEESADEVFKLKNELGKRMKDIEQLKSECSRATDKLKAEQQKAMEGSESKEEAASLSKQLEDTVAENSELQGRVTELEESLSETRRELRGKIEEARTLERNLLSTQNETRTLSEELSHLSSAFEGAKSEYDAVVDELEAVNELFEEARQESERNGRESATVEFAQLHRSHEEERRQLKEQLQRSFQENVTLSGQLEDAAKSLSTVRDLESQREEYNRAKTEMAVLNEALKQSSEEVKSLREKEFSLTMSLRTAENELKQAQDELEATLRTWEASRLEYEQLARSAAFRSERGRGLVAAQPESMKLHSYTPENKSGQKTEGLRLKMELLEMGVSMEQLKQENELLEEELVAIKAGVDTIRANAEKQGRIIASKDVRAELRAAREQEQKEFENHFNSLVYENAALERRARDAEIALSVANEAADLCHEEVSRLEAELRSSKIDQQQVQERVLLLTAELERANEGNERIVHQVRSTLGAESDMKAQSLQSQLNALSIENAALQSKLRGAESLLAAVQAQQQKNTLGGTRSFPLSGQSLENARATIQSLEDEISRLSVALGGAMEDSAGVRNEKNDMLAKLKEAEAALVMVRTVQMASEEDLRNQLQAAKDESMELKTKLSNMDVADEERNAGDVNEDGDQDGTSSDDLQALREQLEKLAEAKAVLQQQVDDARISLSLSNYEQERQKEELKTDLENLGMELLKKSDEQRAAISILREIGTILDSMGADAGNDEKKPDIGFALPSHEAETVLRKVSQIKSAQQGTNDEEVVISSLRRARALATDSTDEKDNEAGLAVQVRKLQNEKIELQSKIEVAETALMSSIESLQEQKIEVELCEAKYKESRREATNLKSEVQQLQKALENAQRDHTQLREQLESLDGKVLELCNEAEERGKALATAELKAGIKSLQGQERKELVMQFKKFYEENNELQHQLVEKEAALLTSRGSERNAKDNHVEATARVQELEEKNASLRSELDSMKLEFQEAHSKYDAVVSELDEARKSLAEIREGYSKSQDAVTSRDGTTSTSIQERDAKIRLLQDQFQKLSAKSVELGRKVEEAENAVTSVRESHAEAKVATETRTRKALKLQTKMEKAVEDYRNRDEEIGELAVMMENRVSMAEETVNKLEREISVAKGSLQVSQAGLLVMKRDKLKNEPSTSSSSSTAGGGGGTTTSSSSPEVEPEARDDFSLSSSSGPSIKRRRSRSFPPRQRAVIARHRLHPARVEE